MLVEAAMGSALISGYKAISDIYKRHIDAKNGDLEQLKSCAAILSDNCKEWSRILIEAFDEAVKRWENEGRQAAESEIMRLQEDFLKLDYHYLEENSEIIIFLKNDFRFNSFADSCVRFYISALDVKKIVYGEIKNHRGEYISSYDNDIRTMVNAWKYQVEKMLRDVNKEYAKILVLKKQ